MAKYNIKFKDSSESLMHYGTANSGRYKRGSQNNAGNKHFYKYIDGIAYIVDDKGNMKRPTLNPEHTEEYKDAGLQRMVPSNPHISTDEKMEIANRNVENWEKVHGRRMDPKTRKRAVRENLIEGERVAKERAAVDNPSNSLKRIKERDNGTGVSARDRILDDQVNRWQDYGFNNKNEARVSKINNLTATEYFKKNEELKSPLEKTIDTISDYVVDYGSRVLDFLGIRKRQYSDWRLDKSHERGQVPWGPTTENGGKKVQYNRYTGEMREVKYKKKNK